MQHEEFLAEMRRGFVEAWLSRYPRLRDEEEMARRFAAVIEALYGFTWPLPDDRAPTEKDFADAEYMLAAAKEQIDFVRKINQDGALEQALVSLLGAPGGEA